MDTKKSEGRDFAIVGGPNKDMLFDACKYAYSKSTRVGVEFSVVAGYTTPIDDPGCAYVLMSISDMKITGIEHEDGSGESFNLIGYCRVSLSPLGNSVLEPYKFNAYYNAKSRKGSISFSK